MAQLLLVDDERDLRRLYAEELAEEGHEVKTAGDGAEAEELLRQFEFDLLILDIQLGRESGLQVLQKVAREIPDLPVLLCTAYSCYKDDFTAWLADDYLVKGSDVGELKEKVRRLLAARGNA